MISGPGFMSSCSTRKQYGHPASTEPEDWSPSLLRSWFLLVLRLRRVEALITLRSRDPMTWSIAAAAPANQSVALSRREARLSLDLRRDLAWSPADAAALDALIRGRPQVGVFLTTAWLSGF